MLAQRAREAIARPLARGATDDTSQTIVLGDQADEPCPCRDRVDGLRQRHADHAADRVAGATRPPERFEVCDQHGDFRGVENCCELVNRLRRWYLVTVHGAVTSVVQTPGSVNFAGVIFAICRGNPTRGVGRKTPVNTGDFGGLRRIGSVLGSGPSALRPAPVLTPPLALTAHARTLSDLQWSQSESNARGTGFRAARADLLAPLERVRTDPRLAALRAGRGRSRVLRARPRGQFKVVSSLLRHCLPRLLAGVRMPNTFVLPFFYQRAR